MTYRYGHKSFREAISDLYVELWLPVQRNSKEIWAGAVALSLFFSILAFWRIRPSIAEFPLFLASGVIRTLQYISVALLLVLGVIARICGRAIEEWLEHLWVENEKRKKPNQSFPIPYWRFRFAFFVCAVAAFVCLATPVLWLFYWVPGRFPGLDHVLDAMWMAKK